MENTSEVIALLRELPSIWQDDVIAIGVIWPISERETVGTSVAAHANFRVGRIDHLLSTVREISVQFAE
jgi:hypothetical protein